MRTFIYKVAIIFIFFIIFYEFTIGKELRFLKNNYMKVISAHNLSQHKDNFLEEIDRLNNKEYIVYPEDAKIISKFIKKIISELNIN